MIPGITVAIPSIPPRAGLLQRAVGSVLAQELPAAGISVAVDLEKQGAAVTRDRALRAVATQWTAFLDDDDVMLPEHLRVLADAAEESGADYVFSYFTIINDLGQEVPGADPLGHFGTAFDPADPHQTTITILVRTELAQDIGFRDVPDGALINGQRYAEDFDFTVRASQAGARIVHVPQRSWQWAHHGRNTSGRNDRW